MEGTTSQITIVHGNKEIRKSGEGRSLGDVAQKTSSPPPMTPKRTAPPVARMLAERPAAPPLLPLELLVEVGVEPEPEGLLLVREDKWDATLEALDLTEDNEETMEEEEAGRIKSASITRKQTSVHTATKGSLDGRGLLEVGSGTIGRETRLNGLLVLSVGADTRSVGAERGERDKPLGVMSGRQKRELTRYTGKSFQRR